MADIKWYAKGMSFVNLYNFCTPKMIKCWCKLEKNTRMFYSVGFMLKNEKKKLLSFVINFSSKLHVVLIDN